MLQYVLFVFSADDFGVVFHNLYHLFRAAKIHIYFQTEKKYVDSTTISGYKIRVIVALSVLFLISNHDIKTDKSLILTRFAQKRVEGK